MKKMFVGAVLAIATLAGCFSQTTPKQKSTTQGLTSPRDAATGQTGG